MDYEFSIAIAAPRERVWSVLTDVERWPEWTASMRSVQYAGTDRLTLGARVRIKQPGMPALVWEVTDLVPQESFSWQARSAGITTLGLHQLAPGAAGGVTVRLGLRQSGPLAGLVGLLTARRTRRYVQMEAEGLKRRSEEAAQAPPA
jgi:uncharacterized protein YndB with AHSA1/START domain